MKITLLTAAMPLVKTFEMSKGVLVKHSYPNAKHFTSHEHNVDNIYELHSLLSTSTAHKSKPCLLKGELTSPLKNESRAQMCEKHATSRLLCLDFDEAPFLTPAEAMKALGLQDISYVWQYSSSAKLNKEDKTLNGHAFLIMDKAMPPGTLRAWLMYMNLRVDALRKGISLAPAKQALHWPLDIVVNDNNRLIYISTPIFKGLADPLKPTERLAVVKRAFDELPTAKIPLHAIEALRQEQKDLINELRKKEGLPALRAKVKQVGEFEVQQGVGEATTYEVIDDNEWWRYNLNGGDSQAYWHPKNNFEYLHNFKGEPSMLLKEILPQRYAELTGMAKDTLRTPNQDGDLLLAFREKRTAEYWKGVWNPRDQILDIHTVKNKDQLEDFMQGHGTTVGPYVPEWQLIFDPTKRQVIDQDNHIINKFIEPHALREGARCKGEYPIIQKALDSAVGTGPVQEHFLNWLAVIMQHRRKTRTAWVLHGTQGTGKGILINKVIRKLLGEGYTEHILATALSSDFDGWQEHKLFVFIDEIEVDMFEKKAGVEAKLKKMITEDTDDIHRKGQTRYSVPSFVNLIFGSNKPYMVQIPGDDRRFNVGSYQSRKWTPTREDIEVLLPKELPHFAHYIMTREADIDLAGQIIHTEDRKNIQELNMPASDQFARAILAGDLYSMFEHMPDERMMNEHGLLSPAASAYASMLKRFVTEEVSRISRDELGLLFEHAVGPRKTKGVNSLTTYLRHRGIHLTKLWHNNSSTPCIDVTWTWANAAQKKEILDSLTVKPVQKLRKVK